MPLLAVLYLALLGALLGGLLGLKRPSNTRDWKPDMARPARAELQDSLLTLHNVRNIRYGAPGTPVEAAWDTRSYDLSEVKRLWFVVESFSQLEVIAHTLLSFEFEGGDYLAFSAEARLKRGEKYGILRGLLRDFELMYTFGDERDFVLRRTNYQDHDVYLYPLTLPPNEVQAILTDILTTANVLRKQPRFYNSVSCNCTNLLFRHINRARPGTFGPLEPAQVLPGLSDRLLYNKGLIDTTLPFTALRDAYNVHEIGQRYRDNPEVSERLREGLPERPSEKT